MNFDDQHIWHPYAKIPNAVPTYLVESADNVYLNLEGDKRVIDGVSIKQTLLNHLPSERNKIIFYREREIYAVRYGDYKAHFIIKGAYNYPEGSNQKIVLENPLLYNLSVDPSEKFNIAKKFPEKVKEIKKIAEDHLKSFEPPKSLLESRTSDSF